MSDAQLPPEFAVLEPYAGWAIAGTANRAQRRDNSTEAERRAFFNATKDLVPSVLVYLDRKPLGAFDEKEQRLMNLVLMFCHVALSVEQQGDQDATHAKFRQHMRIVRTPADVRAPPQ